jgi:hypothetical protein
MPEKRTLYTRNVWLTASLLVAVAAVFLVYTALERRVDNAGEARFESMQLADELRQSSDDLTRMARTYVVTGDPSYKKYYQAILDIRDGKLPRPMAYQDIYWDRVVADKTAGATFGGTAHQPAGPDAPSGLLRQKSSTSWHWPKQIPTL